MTQFQIDKNSIEKETNDIINTLIAEEEQLIFPVTWTLLRIAPYKYKII